MNKVKIITWNIKERCNRANFRRDMKTVLFGAWFGEKFSDNPRFLFQYLSENRSALGLNRVVWVTRDEAVCETIREMGYEAYMMDSEESLRCHRTAGVHIICNGAADDPANPHADILGRYSTGAVKINATKRIADTVLFITHLPILVVSFHGFIFIIIICSNTVFILIDR